MTAVILIGLLMVWLALSFILGGLAHQVAQGWGGRRRLTVLIPLALTWTAVVYLSTRWLVESMKGWS